MGKCKLPSWGCNNYLSKFWMSRVFLEFPQGTVFWGFMRARKKIIFALRNWEARDLFFEAEQGCYNFFVNVELALTLFIF